MENQRPRRRLRISTLMLVVIIVALSMALVVERRDRWQAEQKLRVSAELARAESSLRQAKLQRALEASQEALSRFQAQSGQSRRTPGESPGGTTGEAGRAGRREKSPGGRAERRPRDPQ